MGASGASVAERRGHGRSAQSAARRLAFVGLLAPLVALAASPTAAAPVEVQVVGDAPKNGIFDPSVEYAAVGGDGWLVYSAVSGDVSPWGPEVETHLARSQDGGATWVFEASINESIPAALQVPGLGTVTGFWNYEVSSLVHDPGDAGAEWKLFSHRIFRRDQDGFTSEQNLPAYSWIVLRTAPTPTGPWSPELALLSSGPLPPAPFDSVAVAVNGLDGSLAGLLVYSEPGAFVHGGVLYLSLTGLTQSGADRIVLLASDDHGASWRYVGTPLVNADAPPLGYLGFDGSAIAEEAGRVFLLVTPQSASVLHDGTLVFEFESLAEGRLVRTAGVPVVHLQLPAQPGLPTERRGGQADYHAGNSQGGLLQPSLQAQQLPVLFHFSSTGVKLVEDVALPVLGPGAQGVAIAALVLVGGIAVARGRRSEGSRKRGAARGPGSG